MSQKVIAGTPQLADAIRRRRQELSLTIEEAASKAGIGTKPGAVTKLENPSGRIKLRESARR